MHSLKNKLHQLKKSSCNIYTAINIHTNPTLYNNSSTITNYCQTSLFTPIVYNKSTKTLSTTQISRINNIIRQLINTGFSTNPISHYSTMSSNNAINTIDEGIPKINVVNNKSRQSFKTYPQRFNVPVNKVDWNITYNEYKPTDYTDPKTVQHSSDPTDVRQVQDIHKRHTYENNGKLNIDNNTGRPLNPCM